MAVDVVIDNQFSKCLPSFRTNIAQCGTVTVCDVSPPTPSDLEEMYSADGKYRLMRHLLDNDIEMRMCGSVTNSLYDLFQTLTVDISNRLEIRPIGPGVRAMMPFVMGMRRHPINNVYWQAWNGTSVSGGNFQYDLTSPAGIPVDERWFNPGENIYLSCVTSGLVVHSTFVVVSVTVTTATVGGVANTPVCRVIVSPQNSGSFLTTAQTTPPTGTNGPTSTEALAVITRGTPNVTDYETYCKQAAGLINKNFVPFWLQGTRHTLCNSERYQQWRDMLMTENLAYAKLADLPEIDENRQLSDDFKRRHVEAIFRQPPISANQTLENYNSLEQITATEAAALDLPIGGECVGYRANATGIYEQFAECGRLCDAGGGVLSLDSLFESIYLMMRVRQGASQAGSDVFDIMTDRNTAELFNQAMIDYYDAQAGGDRMRLVKNIDGDNNGGPRKSKFGFFFNSYNLLNPNVTINIITHNYFNDWSDRMSAEGQGGAGRVLWIIDWSGIKIGVVAANTVINKTGDLQTLAQVDSAFLCTMRVNSQKVTLTSMQYTVMVECPQGSLIIENFAATKPTVTVTPDIEYPCTQS